MNMSDVVRCYFSFRSPYSWLAIYRISRIKDQLPVRFEFVPCFPPGNSEKFSRKDLNKASYISKDVRRFTEAYGLELNWPEPFDTEWIPPHAAYLYAEEQGRGVDFANAAYTVRFSKGLDIGREDNLRVIAAECGLDPDHLIRCANDENYRQRVLEGMAQSRRDRMFGVPFFIYNGQTYWGNDRVEWLIRDIYRDLKRPVPDLAEDPMARPY